MFRAQVKKIDWFTNMNSMTSTGEFTENKNECEF